MKGCSGFEYKPLTDVFIEESCFNQLEHFIFFFPLVLGEKSIIYRRFNMHHFLLTKHNRVLYLWNTTFLKLSTRDGRDCVSIRIYF
jgi:hypothetical protein